MSHAPLTVERILGWADSHRARTGRWPTADTGPVGAAPGQTWQAVNRALMRGSRGLPYGLSLARVLAGQRGVRNRAGLKPLTEEQVLLWADRHYRRTGRWPSVDSGSVSGAPGENWKALASALYAGNRGLHGGETLRYFLRRHGRDVPELRGRRPATATGWRCASC